MLANEWQHGAITVDDGIHPILSANVTDGAARLALGWGTADVGKAVYQQDTRAFWVLRSDPSGASVEWAQLGTAPNVAPLHVYLSPAGNDSNAGTSPASPRRTVAGAWALLPPVLVAPFTLHMASGSYDWVAPPDSLSQVGARGCINVVGDGAGQAGDDGCTVTSSGTITAGSTAVLCNVSEVLPANARRGYTFEVAGSRRHITANTTSSVSLSEGIPTFTAGTPYRIVRPGVLIDMKGTSASDRRVFARCALINLVNLRIRGGNAEFLACAFVSLFGVEGESQLFLGDHTLAGHTSVYPFLRNVRVGNTVAYFTAWTTAANIAATAVQWNGWGLTAISATPHVSQYQGIDFADGATYEGYLTHPMIQMGPGAHNITLVLLGGALGNLVPSGMGQRYNFGGAFLIGQGNGLDSRETLSIGNNSEIVCTANLTVQNSGSYELFLLRDQARFVSLATVNLMSASGVATHYMKLTDSAEAYLATVSALGNTSIRHFSVSGTARLFCATWTSTNSGGGYTPNIVTDQARAVFGTLTTCAINVSGCAQLTVGTLSSKGVYGCSVLGGRFTVSGSCLITNYSAAIDALRLAAGGEFYCAQNPAIATSGGGPNYGVNCRGGGRFYCAVAPTGVVGVTADFTVGTGAGEDFNDDALAASFSYKAAGPSACARTA